MDGFAGFFIEGNILAKMLILQVAVAVLVLFLLKKFFDRELFLYAMEQLSVLPDGGSFDVQEIAVLTAGKISEHDASRLTALIKMKFPRARIIMAEDASLWGGFVMRVGQKTLDCSLLLKIKQLFRISDQ